MLFRSLAARHDGQDLVAGDLRLPVGALAGAPVEQGEDIAQSDPNTKHVTEALESMECVVVQDLFLNETAAFAHVFLPGTSFLEKDGTFTNAERRINRVRKVMTPKNGGLADWEITVKLSNAMGFPMAYRHPSEIMDEIAKTTPGFASVSYDFLDKVGSIQWPCNEKAPMGTPTSCADQPFLIGIAMATGDVARRLRNRGGEQVHEGHKAGIDRKSTRLNSSHRT